MILGIESYESDDAVMIYPNPATDVINLRGGDIQYVEIYNSVGMKVASKSITDSESIKIDNLASGIYFMRILDKKGNVSTTKIVKR